ncbi:alpha/beta hydrolase [Nocardia sp. NPDC050718]|uniref:alpha/beta hydrolase n=1 Tax=Nocardia sp. NPDC050718 TaxID=3155788 RepID=UPI0033E419CA
MGSSKIAGPGVVGGIAAAVVGKKPARGPEQGIIVNSGRTSTSSRVLMGACVGVIGPLLRTVPINRATIPIGAVAVDLLSRLRPEPHGIEREQIQLDGFRMEMVRPAGGSRALRHGAVLYMHGGGFAVGGLESHRAIVAGIARRTGLAVLNVEYRQLPGRAITESIDDCVLAYRWLLRHGADPAKIVFAGDSAGGFLTFATALRSREIGLPLPAALVGLSPLLDLDYRAKEGYVNVTRDAYIPLSGLEAVVRLGAEATGPLDPALSPVNAELTGMPPVLLIAAEDELLRYDCELMAHRLTAAGVPVILELWRGQVHAFMSILPSMPESRSALGRVAKFVRVALEPAQRARTA